MGMCDWVSDSRESAWLANPCELRVRITGLLYAFTMHTPTRMKRPRQGDFAQYEEGLRFTVGFARVRFVCETMRIPNPHHSTYLNRKCYSEIHTCTCDRRGILEGSGWPHPNIRSSKGKGGNCLGFRMRLVGGMKLVQRACYAIQHLLSYLRNILQRQTHHSSKNFERAKTDLNSQSVRTLMRK